MCLNMLQCDKTTTGALKSTLSNHNSTKKEIFTVLLGKI